MPRLVLLARGSMLPLLAALTLLLPVESASLPVGERWTSAVDGVSLSSVPIGVQHTVALEPDRLLQVRRVSSFAWPATGPLTSYFGGSHPTGIDIGLGNGNDPILASADGVVSFAGGSACCDYGLYVVIEHEGGFSTLYAHLSRIAVSKGQQVRQGDVLGIGGATGEATGNHLHFELKSPLGYLDPLRFLPSRQTGLLTSEAWDCDGPALAVDAGSFVTLALASPETVVESAEVVAASGGAPAVTAQIDDTHAVSVAVPPALAATSRTLTYNLSLTLRRGEEHSLLSCALALTTVPTLPNPPSQRPHAYVSAAEPGTTQVQSLAAPSPSDTPSGPTQDELNAQLMASFLAYQQLQAAQQAAQPNRPGATPPPVVAPPTLVASPTATPSATSTPAPSATTTPTSTPTPQPTATPTASATPSAVPTLSGQSSPTATPTTTAQP